MRVLKVRDDLVHLAADNFTVSFMRDCDCLEVALIVGDDIEVIDALLVPREHGGKAIKLLKGWVELNMSGFNTTNLEGKMNILTELCESFEYTWPTYIAMKTE